MLSIKIVTNFFKLETLTLKFLKKNKQKRIVRELLFKNMKNSILIHYKAVVIKTKV